MLLYDGGIEALVPEGYSDISHLFSAQSYQYIFAGSNDKDDFLIIDLMEPTTDVDMHIEDILEMNDVKRPSVLAVEYTTEEFRKSLDIFLAKYSCGVLPAHVDLRDGVLPWMCAHMSGVIARSDNVPRQVHIVVGVLKHALSDIVISLFREGEVSEEGRRVFRDLIHSVRVLNTDMFIAK